MNCHSSHLREDRGSRTLPGHAHSSSPGQSPRSSCPASFALRKPQLPRELRRRNFFCLCPSFLNLWPHTLVHLWQAADLGPGRGHRAPPRPPLSSVFCTALRHLCDVRSEWAGKLGELQNRLLEQKGYITVRHRAEDACRNLIPWTGTLFNMHACFFIVWHAGRNRTDEKLILSGYCDSF